MHGFSVSPARRLVSPVFYALVLSASSCVADGGGTASHDLSPGPVPSVADARASASAGHGDRFVSESALGAKCLPNHGGEPPLQGAACYGRLPDHLQALLRNLPDSHPFLSRKQRAEAADQPQWFLPVQGYGGRQDYVAAISSFGSFWIRSFEGPDPATTVYIVYGPDCILDDTHPGHVRCLPGAPAAIRDIRIYRARGDALPEDVTAELAAPAPVLTASEREHYGIYLRSPEDGSAEDTDIGLDVRSLDTTPIMRWVIAPAEEGDYDRPRIPDSDSRGFLQQAHFGFLVWTGERFELREKIPLALWACGVGGVGDGSCLAPFAGHADPYLSQAGAPGRPYGDVQ